MSLPNRGHLMCLGPYEAALMFSEYQLNTDLNLKESEGFAAYLIFPICKMFIFFITHFEVYSKKMVYDFQF